MIELPIKYSYWVEENKILAGEYPRDLDEKTSLIKMNKLLNSGISVFIDLTKENDNLFSYSNFLKEAIQLKFPIPDLSIPPSKKLTIQILDAIEEHTNSGKKVYIHCWGGVGRTGVIVGCWFVRSGLSGKEALIKLKKLWKTNPKSLTKPNSPETLEQENYILNWKE